MAAERSANVLAGEGTSCDTLLRVHERGLAYLDLQLMVIRLNADGDSDLTSPSQGYEVDIEDIRGPEDLVPWVFHLRSKWWFNAQMMADFLFAFEYAYKQSFGVDILNVRTHWDWPKRGEH